MTIVIGRTTAPPRATEGAGISHQDIVEAMGVTRATVSGLLAALERQALVKSTVDTDDRRKLIARLTAKDQIVVERSVQCRYGEVRQYPQLFRGKNSSP